MLYCVVGYRQITRSFVVLLAPENKRFFTTKDRKNTKGTKERVDEQFAHFPVFFSPFVFFVPFLPCVVTCCSDT